MDKIISSLVVSEDEGGREFLQHEYNRDGDSYRSPWDNKYSPATESSFYPSPALRVLEEKAHNIFSSYVKLYYNEAVSTVILMDPVEGAAPGFSGCYLVKKVLEKENKVTDATWDGTHIVVVTFNGDMANY